MTTIELFHLRRVRDKPRAAALLSAHASLTAEAALAAGADDVLRNADTASAGFHRCLGR